MKTVAVALCAAVASTLGAAVDVQAEVGLSRARIRDGDQVMTAGFQPALTWRDDAAVAAVLGLRAGPVVVYEPQDQTRSGAIEARLLAGLGWLPASGPRCDLLAGWGGGYWRDDGLTGDGGWGRVVSAEATATWALDDRLRVGPSLGWTRHEIGAVGIDDWRIAVAVAYRLDG